MKLFAQGETTLLRNSQFTMVLLKTRLLKKIRFQFPNISYPYKTTDKAHLCNKIYNGVTFSYAIKHRILNIKQSSLLADRKQQEEEQKQKCTRDSSYAGIQSKSCKPQSL